MWKAGKQVANLLLLTVFLFTNLVATGWAKQTKPFVEDIWAWQEGHEVRLQLELGKKYERVELAVAQNRLTDKLAFKAESRLSVAVSTGVHDPVYVQLRAFDSKRMLESALYRFIPARESGDTGIAIKKVEWEGRHLKEKEKIDLELVAQSSVRNESTMEKQAKAFAKRTRDGEKPKESEAKAAPATFEVEPNDVPEKADWLFAGKDAYGKIGKSGDLDYWKIKATAEGKLKFWLGELPSGQDYDLYIFDSEKRELGKSEQSGSVDELVEGIATEKNAWYYVMVRGKGNHFDKKSYYRLKAEFLLPNVEVKPDVYEPNNQAKDAHKVENPSSIEGNIHAPGDVDFYRVDVPLASTIDLSLGNIPEGMDLDLYLFDKDQKQVAKSEKAKNSAERIEYNGDPGAYYIKVVAGRNSAIIDHAYKLDVKAHTIPVILIPGIGGSRLSVRENGQVSEAWLNLTDMMWDVGEDKHRKVLTLQPQTPGSSQVAPRHKGVDVFPEAEDGGFRAIEYLAYGDSDYLKEKSEQYFSMVQHLREMGYQKHTTLFAFPYDWRYSISDNAALLKKKMDEAIEKSRAKQVQLVAHSMGGLLVKETLLTNASYQAKTKRVIYLGTPFLGAPLAYQAIKYGYNFGIPLLTTETGRQIAEYSPAVHELLPSKEYAIRDSFLRLLFDEKSRPFTYEEFLKDQRIRLPYDPLIRQSMKLHKKWDEKKLYVSQYSVVGQGHTTLLGYEYNQYQKLLTPFFDKASGDGTVPFISANYNQKDIRKQFYVNEEHSRLTLNPHVIQQVAHLLLGIEVVQTGISSTPIKSHSYNYYVIYQQDDKLPNLSIKRNGKSIVLSEKTKEDLDGLKVEYHGNVIVVHVLDNGNIQFYSRGKSSTGSSSKIFVHQFSSDFSGTKQNKGKIFILENDQLTEFKDK